jgi:adenosylhomocysteine nucleosidase
MASDGPVGVVAAMVGEAACLAGLDGGPGVIVHRGGIGPHRAAEAARALLAEGCRGLVSFGIAGGLDPSLAPGALLLPEGVLSEDGRRHATDRAWRMAVVAALTRAGMEVGSGTLVGSAKVVMTPADKRRLREASGAVAVDMESHAVAAVAAVAAVPFLVVRAISDPATTAIPRSALKGVQPDGSPRILPVLWELVRRPTDLPGLMRLRRDSARGLETLRRVALRLGSGFGLGDQTPP